MLEKFSLTQSARYDSIYFENYRDDKARERMYQLEYNRISQFQNGGKILDVAQVSSSPEQAEQV